MNGGFTLKITHIFLDNADRIKNQPHLDVVFVNPVLKMLNKEELKTSTATHVFVGC